MTREQALKTLDLHSGASFHAIKQAYRDLALVWHPDRFAHSTRLQEKASEKLKEINTAYDVLRSYDADPSRAHEPKTKHDGSNTGSSAEHSEPQNSGNRRSRPWKKWSALARAGIERVPAPVAIAGHLVAVVLLFSSFEVIRAIVFAVIFTFAPLIYIRRSTGAESWGEAITQLWHVSVLIFAVLAVVLFGGALLIVSVEYAAIAVLEWFGIENPLEGEIPIAAPLLLLVAVMFYLYRFARWCLGRVKEWGD